MDNLSQPPQAGIIGAGIAGLASAIALRRAGWDVTVYEKSSFRSEIGAAITISPNATRTLERWGWDYKTTQPVAHQRLTNLFANDLSVIVHERIPDTIERFGAECWAFHRVDLHNGLLDLATTEEANAIGKKVDVKLKNPVVDVDCEAGTISLADGTQVQKDLIVVADGAHSNTVESVTGKREPLKLTGRSTFRCLIPRDVADQDPEVKTLIDNPLTGMTGFLDPVTGTFMIIYMCRGGSLLNIAIVHATKPDLELTDAWNSPASIDDVLEVTKNFHPTVLKLLKMAEDIKVYHLMYREPLEHFGRGKAIVLGDAAHPMLPTMASGAAVTIESAAALEGLFNLYSTKSDISQKSHLSNDSIIDASTAPIQLPPISERIALFDTIRIPRCNMVQILSNAGFGRHQAPEVVAQLRRYYSGPIPPKEAAPWTAPFRDDILFPYDIYAEVEKGLKSGSNGYTAKGLVINAQS